MYFFFKNEIDIHLFCIYLWNEDAPAYDVVNVDFFHILETDISYYDNLGDVYVCGDLNTRVGLIHDFIRNDNINSFCDDPDYIPDEYSSRTSLDTRCNNFGSKM